MSLRAYLRLIRIPNVFTAFADVAAGVCIARAGGFQWQDLRLVLASGWLYCAGMVWNDYFDHEVDAVERPERPIPSGAVSLRSAAILGFTLSALGLTLAALHGRVALAIAASLLVAILAYDAALKDTWAGPITMGMCRALNVLLGLGAHWSARAFTEPLWIVLGIFTLLITRLSRFEVAGTERARVLPTLRAFSALAVVGCAVLAWYAQHHAATPLGWLAAGSACALVLWRERQLLGALWQTPSGPNLGRAIGGGIMLMPAIDASFVAASGAPLSAAATCLCMLPALLLKRFFYAT